MSSRAQEHKIGLPMAITICLNAMIGVGIFLVPSALACKVGPAGILTYVFVIFAVWCMGSSIARLAYLYPQEGAFYIYAKQWGGHSIGLLTVTSYILGLVVAMGLLSQIAGIYLQGYSTTLATQYSFIPPLSAQLWTTVSIILFTLFNLLGLKAIETTQIILLILTIIPLFATTALCLLNAKITNLMPFFPQGITSIFAAAKAVIFGFFGFECATTLHTMVKNPEKNVSRALTWAILITGTIYLTFVSSIFLAIPINKFCANAPITDILQSQFPQLSWFIILLHATIVIAILGTLYSIIWSIGSLLFSCLKLSKSAFIHDLIKRNIITHKISIIVTGLGILISSLIFNNIDLFFSVTSIFIVCAFISSIITLLTLKSEWKSGENIRTVFGLGTAGIIIYFSCQEIIKHLMS